MGKQKSKGNSGRLSGLPMHEIQNRIDSCAEQAYAVHQERRTYMQVIQSLVPTSDFRTNRFNDMHRRKARTAIDLCDQRLAALAEETAVLQQSRRL